MKNIGNYIQESQMFEADESMEKYQEELTNLVQTIVNNYEDSIDGDWDEDELKDYIKKTVEGIEGEALDVLTKACIETAKQLDKVSNGFDSDEDDDANESLNDHDENLITEGFLDDLEKMAKDAGVDTKKVKKGLNNMQKDAERTWRKATDQETFGDKIHDFGEKVDNTAGRKLRTATGNATAEDKVRNFGEKIDNTVGRKIRTATGNDTAEDKVRNFGEKSRSRMEEIRKNIKIQRDVNKGVITSKDSRGKNIFYKTDKDGTKWVKYGDKEWTNIDSPSATGERLDDFKNQMKKYGDDWNKLSRKKQDEIVKEIESGRGAAYNGLNNYTTYDPSDEGNMDTWKLGRTTTDAQDFWAKNGTAIVLGVAATAAIAIASYRHIKKKRNEKMLAGLKDRAENASDHKTRKEYKNFYDSMLNSLCKDNGRMRTSPKMSKIPKEYRKDFEEMYKSAYNDKSLRKEGRKYIKDNGSDFIQYDRSRRESTPKEQVAKAKDGSEIHARRKKSGHGMTYVRTKNGKEVGYATKDDFRRARQNEGMISLRDALLESFEI